MDSYCKKILLSISLIFLIPSYAIASEAETPYPFEKPVFEWSIRAYQLFISPTNQDSCVMYPTCSGYALEAFNNYSFGKAYLMTSDRLMRSHRDLKNYNVVIVNDKLRFEDPPVFQTDGTTQNLIAVSTESPSYTIFGDVPLPLSSTQDPDALMFRFARELEAQGDYKTAMTEYKRLASYYPSSPYAEPGLVLALLCDYMTGQYTDTITFGEYLLLKVKPVYYDLINFYMAASYVRLQQYPAARSRLEHISQRPWLDKAILLSGFSYAAEGHWTEAQKVFASVPQDSIYYEQVPSLIEECERGNSLPLKSPAVAGVLGVVPGLGYLYSGYPETALSAFLTNLVFGMATARAFQNDNDGLGVFLGSLAAGWYAGSIYGSVKTATMTNSRMEKQAVVQLKLGFTY